MKATKWAYVFGSLEVEIYDTLEDAADDAEYASDYGRESLSCIEYDGNLYDIWWVNDRARAKREASPPRPPAPPVTHRVEVKSPDGEWVVYTDCRSDAEAQREYDDCIDALSKDRVRITMVDTD